MEKKNKFLIILAIILFVLVICLGGYVVYDKVFSENKKGDTTDKNEIILDNVKFGYNKSSKDFFVKVTRGDAEYKYPTEDIMKVKAYILQELEAQNK